MTEQIYHTDNFDVKMEEFADSVLLHCRVYNWSKSVYLELLDALMQIAARS
jgi:activator of HSP90 ATPase